MMFVYTPRETPMNVVVFFSGGASSLRAMLQDTNYGKLYRVTGAFTDREDASGIALCRDNGIEVIYIGRRKFYKEKGFESNNPDSRKHFYEAVCREIEGFEPDIIALSGYMHIVSDPLLEEYENRVLNVHPADLTILSGPRIERLYASCLDVSSIRELRGLNSLERKFKGDNAVYDAIAAGEKTLRSTIHFATEDFDEGPAIVQSGPFVIDALPEDAASYARQVQDRMKTECDGPAYLKALELIATGRISVEGDTVFLDDRALPYCGYRLS